MNAALDDLDLGRTRPADGAVILAGRYRIVHELGRGGMGTVYLAEDIRLEGRRVAIKTPPAVLARSERAVETLKREALVAMELAHPHIVTLRAFEQGDDGVFLVMDYVEGRTLDALLLQHGKLDVPEVLRIFRPIAEALDYAHARGVVHRDVKPGNIMIAADGCPYVSDFGIASEMRSSVARITGREGPGTLAYASPEQLRGREPTPAQDVYGLAATIYQCLAGRPPFAGEHLAYQVEHDTPPLPDGPPELVQAVMRGLSKRPEDRPQTCGQLLGDRAAEIPPERTAAAPAERAAGGASPGINAGCPRCGWAHHVGDAFCSRCGAWLVGVGGAEAARPRRCPRCGEAAGRTDKFCSVCGKQVGSAP